MYIRIVHHLCYRVSEFVLPPICDDKLISFGGGGAGEMLVPKLVLGVQSGVDELCSICAICATSFSSPYSIKVWGAGEMLAPKLVLGVQNGVIELC